MKDAVCGVSIPQSDRQGIVHIFGARGEFESLPAQPVYAARAGVTLLIDSPKQSHPGPTIRAALRRALDRLAVGGMAARSAWQMRSEILT